MRDRLGTVCQGTSSLIGQRKTFGTYLRAPTGLKSERQKCVWKGHLLSACYVPELTFKFGTEEARDGRPVRKQQ